MRVLHVAQPTSGGVAVVTAQLVADQVAAGYDVHLACPSDGGLASAGGTYHRWEATRSPGPSVAGETRRLAAVVRSVAPDLVHLHSSKAGLAGRLAIRGRVPTVFAPHAWSFLAARGPQRRAALAWERLAARWTDALVAVSDDELAVGRAHGIKGTAYVVPNGVDVDRFAALERPDEPLAVCVGRLCEQKGQDLLLAAWPASYPLALVGGGPDEAALRAIAPPNVTFVGEVADPRPWYAAADVVVLPSRWEGMALVPLEAMAAGRSVVAFGVAGVRESVPENAGAVVAPGDVKALVAAVVERLDDRARARREGEAGRAHVTAHHDVRTTTARVREIYEAVLTR